MKRYWPLGLAAIPLFFLLNWGFQATRKPAEVAGLFEGPFFKSPRATWAAYGHLFEAHSTDVISSDLLAAIAQAETRGNPIATTYWVWSLDWNPLNWYRPASSAIGLYQFTDATFAEARKFCIHDHRVSDRCWLGFTYNRLIPSHAIEMTSAYLHRRVQRLAGARPLEVRRDLAAIIHLCGEAGAEPFLRRGAAPRTCGSHNARAYLQNVRKLRREFLSLPKP